MEESEIAEFNAHLTACESAVSALQEAGKIPVEGRAYGGAELRRIRTVRNDLKANLADLADVFEGLDEQDSDKMRLQSLLLSGEAAVAHFNHMDDE